MFSAAATAHLFHWRENLAIITQYPYLLCKARERHNASVVAHLFHWCVNLLHWRKIFATITLLYCLPVISAYDGKIFAPIEKAGCCSQTGHQ